MSNYKNALKRLLAGVRGAHTELFALMLAERAAKVRGRYTEPTKSSTRRCSKRRRR